MNKFDISTLELLDEYSLKLIHQIKKGDVVFFHGDLGSGKTTLIQHLLKNMGYKGRVKSPTYTLYDVYEFQNLNVIHMDLYRMSSPEELYYLGMEEIFNGENIVLIEWPEKGEKVLPQAQIELELKIVSSETRELIVKNN